MDRIDTRDVELAFDELIKELKKLKDLNSLVDAYKDTVNSLSIKIRDLTEQIETFYISAKNHDDLVNGLYQEYVAKASEISNTLDDSRDELKRMENRSFLFKITVLVLLALTCVGIAYLVFFA